METFVMVVFFLVLSASFAIKLYGFIRGWRHPFYGELEDDAESKQ